MFIMKRNRKYMRSNGIKHEWQSNIDLATPIGSIEACNELARLYPGFFRDAVPVPARMVTKRIKV